VESIKFKYPINNIDNYNLRRKLFMKKYIIILISLSMIFSPLAGSGFAAEDGMQIGDENEFLIHLKAARFDPLTSDPNIPSDLIYDIDMGYYLVQFSGPIYEDWIFEIIDSGGKILGYIPQYTYIVQMEKDLKEKLQDLPHIRWIGLYHPAYKMENNLFERTQTVSLNVMVFESGLGNENLNLVRQKIQVLGGRIMKEEPEADNIVVEISGSKIPDIAFIPQVECIDEYSEPVSLMDNIRVFTGATSPLHEFGFNGTGIVGEVKDSGLDEDHVEFEGQIIGTDPDNIDEDSHGTSTFGIVFAKGVSERAKGMLPDGDGVFCDWAVGRIQSVANLVSNWDGLFQSNSWHSGSADSSYQSNSRQNDEAVFEYDISMLYASGNGGSDGSITREATAKNVITVGGIDHQDNQDRTDDVHNGNQGNKGPVDDGRIKPDVVGPYESIYTTTSGGGYTSGFGGTSGATPVAAGGVGLIYEMYKRNHFGNNPSGTVPHSATVKAILIADAYQYELTQADRMAQGWGLVDVGNVYFMGENHLIDDESESLRTGESQIYNITPTGIHQLKITLVWTDVPGTTSSDLHLINNLNLKVTDPYGTVYWGNYGLDLSKWSSSGGSADSLNNVENVFLESPISGEWTIEVIAENIALDGNTDTIQMDQNYALVASGVIGSDHDMVVSQIEELPRFFSLHKESYVNGTISNIGAQDETNVFVNLLENNDIVDTHIIDYIASGTSTQVSLSWMPAVERTSDMTIEVVQVSGETNLFNNKKTASVDIFAPLGFVLVDNFHGNDQNYDSFYEHLYSIKYPVTFAESEITSDLLGRYNVFITAGATSSYTTEEVTAITNYVENGGGLFVVGDNDDVIYNSLTDFSGIRWATPRGVGGTIDNINPHNTTEGVSELYLDSPNLVLEVSAPALEIAYDSDVILNRPLIAVSEHSGGRVVALSDDNCIDNSNLETSDNKLFGENVILWLNTNLPPLAIIDFPLDASIHSFTSHIQFDGTSSYDPDGYLIDYLWTSDMEGTIGDQKTFAIQLTPGDHEITLRVTDNGGLITTAKIDITVSTPNPPSVSIISPDPGSTHNKVITISGIASDVDGAIERVEVKVGGESWEMATGTDSWDYVWDTTAVTDGEWEIEARAYDGEGLVSEIIEISVFVDNTPPMVFNGPKAQNVTENSAKIVWATNEPGDCIVEYGEDTNYGFTETKSGLITEHEIILRNLKPDTRYHYRVLTKDALGNMQEGVGDKTFTTDPEPDITGPEVFISAPRDGDIISQGVEIEADATDDSGIDYVEFYINNDLKFSDSNPSFSWFWNTNSGDYPDGIYMIKAVAFDNIGNSAEIEISVEVDNEKVPPAIRRTEASPNSIDSQDSSDVLFTVEINDPEKGVESVAIDLSSIGRSSKQRMYDDGTHGDEEAEDGIYSYEATVPPNVDPGEKTVIITVIYNEGESLESEASLLVESTDLGQEDEDEEAGIPLLFLFLFIVIAAILILALVASSSTRNRKNRQKEMVPVSVAQPVYFQPEQLYYQDQMVYKQQPYKK
jgi:hypothetical protein